MLARETLTAIVQDLARRPGHTKVLSWLEQLLREGLGARPNEVEFEHVLPEVRGRADALLGRTVFAAKRDLRRERRDAEEQLERYLAQRERETGDRYLGVATDGAEWAVYTRHGDRLQELRTFKTDPASPRGLLLFLESVVSLEELLDPTPDVVRTVFGKDSAAFTVARGQLAEAWASVRDHPDAELKRKLWAQLLEQVYGSPADDDELFFQHTYLTIVAKTMATLVLEAPLVDAEALLSGKAFRDAGIGGLVESDLFDWVLTAAEGRHLVQRLANAVARVRVTNVRTDVLKAVYESLIDPAQRHDLGEYYTPDWLAARMCDAVIERPLEQRVLDPACGSGTFLFHAARRYLAAAEAAGRPNREALRGLTETVIGVDIHPVAVTIARVTYLLAIGTTRLGSERDALAIPVYLGDSLQWNAAAFLDRREVRIPVPDGPALEFPLAATATVQGFDELITVMLQYSEARRPPSEVAGWLQSRGVGSQKEREQLVATYRALAELQAQGRNHIWGYVARNLGRPIWLSTNEQRADVVIGNPPWVAYRAMSPRTQETFKRQSERYGLWVGGKVATHQDLSACFFVSCIDLYLKPEGRIAFLMPAAALTRQQFAPFRERGMTGMHKKLKTVRPAYRFTGGWDLDRVKPLFPVPACVLMAELGTPTSGLPQVAIAAGELAERDATEAEAAGRLIWQRAPWPAAGGEEGSGYRDRFRQGATFVPRRFWIVERRRLGGLGMAASAPAVRGRTGTLDKPPWNRVEPPAGPVEAEFLRPLYLGESIAPFRPLQPVEAVVPWTRDGTLLDAAGASAAGYPQLAAWLRQTEARWRSHHAGRLTLRQRLDYWGQLSAQWPIAPVRVVYSKAGSLPAAAVLADDAAVIDHMLYWAAVPAPDEARYLVAVLNSEEGRRRVEHLQSRGQWGARHFDKAMFSLPIPAFDPGHALHRELAALAAQAEEVAAAVPVAGRFIQTRQRIRRELQATGLSVRIDQAVARLLAAP